MRLSFSIMDIYPEIALPNKGFNLFFQLDAFFNTVAIVMMKPHTTRNLILMMANQPSLIHISNHQKNDEKNFIANILAMEN